MQKVILGVIMFATVAAVGCGTDKAKAQYERCKKLAASDDEVDLLSAERACDAAVAADPNSESGQAAATLLVDLPSRFKEKVHARAQANAARATAQAAVDANCHNWTTICTIGRFPDGTEQTSGVMRFATKAECQGAGATLGNVACDPCKCRD